MNKLNMSDAELDAVAGGAGDKGAGGGVAGITSDAELDAVAGGADDKGAGGGVAG